MFYSCRHRKLKILQIEWDTFSFHPWHTANLDSSAARLKQQSIWTWGHWFDSYSLVSCPTVLYSVPAGTSRLQPFDLQPWICPYHQISSIRLPWKANDYNLPSWLNWTKPSVTKVFTMGTSKCQTIPFSSFGKVEGSNSHCFIWTAMSNR